MAMRRRPGKVYAMGMGLRWVDAQGDWVVCGDGFLARLWSGVFGEPFTEVVAAPPLSDILAVATEQMSLGYSSS